MRTSSSWRPSSTPPEGRAATSSRFPRTPSPRRPGRTAIASLPVQESLKKPGDGFPVFPTKDVGHIGILICYDMVFPEPMRCLALNGADIVFNPTVGGAAFG